MFNNVVIDLIIAITIVPIAEELFFRGFLFNRLNYKLSNKKYGLLISIIIVTLIFAIAHGFEAAIFIIPSGFVLLMVYLKYNNLLVSITLHAICNLLEGFVGLLTFYNICNIDAFVLTPIGNIVFIILGIIACYFVIKYIISTYKEIS